MIIMSEYHGILPACRIYHDILPESDRYHDIFIVAGEIRDIMYAKYELPQNTNVGLLSWLRYDQCLHILKFHMLCLQWIIPFLCQLHWTPTYDCLMISLCIILVVNPS